MRQRDILIDEHHEAYHVIEEAFLNKTINQPVTLVHVDSHCDTCDVKSSLSCYGTNSRDYVEQCLDIGNYILPLFVKKRISRIIWVGLWDKPKIKVVYGSFRGEGRFIRQVPQSDSAIYPDHVTTRCFETTDIANLWRHIGKEPYILNIDSDYFSCRHIAKPSDFKSSSMCYHKMTNKCITSNDKYRMKLMLSGITRQQYGQDFVFNNSKKWIDLCIDYFFTHLGLRSKASMTIICRSTRSGFTPERHVEHVVELIRSRLMSSPNALSIPKAEHLVPYEHVILKRRRLTNAYMNISWILSDFDHSLMTGILEGRTIWELRCNLLKLHGRYVRDIDYEMFRTIFNLKRTFIIK